MLIHHTIFRYIFILLFSLLFGPATALAQADTTETDTVEVKVKK